MELPKITLPKKKISRVRSSRPPYSGANNDTITNTSGSYINKSIRDVRSLPPIKAIRALARINGMVSTAVQSYISLAMSGYTIAGYDSVTHLFSKEGTKVAESVIANMDTLNDYAYGYNDKQAIPQLLETLVKEVILSGSCAAELVLNDQRMPERIVTFSSEDIEWKIKDKTRKYPSQRTLEGDNVDLNFPTVWVESLNHEASGVYAKSMLEPCLNIVFVFIDFLEDMSRSVRKSGHAKLVANIIVEKAVAAAPSDIQKDPDKLTKYLEAIKVSAEDALKAMEPHDAIVTFDSISVDILSDTAVKSDYTNLLESLNGLVATSLKSMPSVLGLRLGKSSQSISNTETLVFLKLVEAVRSPVETLMSRALTLAARLQGSPTYVKFKFNPVELRPLTEVAAHKSIQQSRILEQLSLGFISDDEASQLLGTGFREEGAPELSGTRFRDNQSVGVDETRISPNNGAQEKALVPDD